VADSNSGPVSPLDGFLTYRRYGRTTASPGVIVSEVNGAGLAVVTARRGRGEAMREAARSVFQVELPSTPRRMEGSDIAFVWRGPDQWLAYRHPAPPAGIEEPLARAFAGLASIADQSHGQILLRVTGPRVRDALAKGLAIDLHPRAFQTGSAAVTAASHIVVHIWQIDNRPTYEIAVARSHALNFWHWLKTSASEYVVELVGMPIR